MHVGTGVHCQQCEGLGFEVPGARGKGIGAAITLIAYDEARQMGYQHGVLFDTELVVPVHRCN